MTHYLLLTSFVLAIGCASTTPAPANPEPASTAKEESSTKKESPQAECKPGEQQVASSTKCLQDDAVCYQLSDGRWCTGPSGSHGNW